jgi:membrane-associated HD superfamily phosphohydrolase
MSFEGFTNAEERELTRLQKTRVLASHRANFTLNQANENAANAARDKVFKYVSNISSRYPGHNLNVRRAAQKFIMKVTKNTPTNIPIHNARNFTSGNARAPMPTYTHNTINKLINNAVRAGFIMGNRTYHGLALKLHPNKASNKRNKAEMLFKRLGTLKAAGHFNR